MDDPDTFGPALELRPATAGANVVLLVPSNDVVFDETWEEKGVRYAALYQVSADLLSGPDRGIESLDPHDARKIRSLVAGPAALLMAKLHKIGDRKGTARASDKDALDVLRLLRGVLTTEVAERMRVLLSDPRSAEAARRGLILLKDLFQPGGSGR